MPTRLSDAQRDAFRPVLDKLAAFPSDHGVQGLLVVRPGYRYKEAGAVTAEPAIVLAVAPKQLDAAAASAATLQASLGVPVVAQPATLEEQLAAFDATSKTIVAPRAPARSPFEALLRNRLPVSFRPPAAGNYTKPDGLALDEVDEVMSLTVCASPEGGWPVLRDFLGTVQHTLTIGMYQFTAPHIADAVTTAMSRADGDMLLTLHPVPEPPPRGGVKAHDRPEADVTQGLVAALGTRFGLQWAPTGKDGVFASAYHIKVAVADGTHFWLSSGNWQSSNQPNVDLLAATPDDPPQRFQHDYNRDYHAVLESPTLAKTYESYLRYDFETARVHEKTPNRWDGPDVVVPSDYAPPAAFAAPPRFFKPLRVQQRKVRVQPLLTPDNYAEKIAAFIQSATSTLFFQNQYINLNVDGNHPEFEALIDALLDRQQNGVDVRIICRDMMTSDKLDLLVAKGFDPNRIRFQSACHNKCIIVDGKAVAFGSHNWSNDGAVTNRDASLIFYDEEIARYFAEIYEYDWARLANAHPAKPRRPARVAEAGDRDEDRVPMSEIDD